MNAILQGILLGGGQAGQAIAGARKEQEDKATRDKQLGFQERQVALAEQSAARDVADRDALAGAAAGIPELAPHAPLMKFKGGPDIVKMLADLNAKRQVRDDEMAERAGVSGVIDTARGTPDTINRGGALDLNANPEAAATSAMVPGRAPMSMDQVRSALAKYKIGPAIFKDMYPPDKFAAGPTGIFNTNNADVVPGTAPPLKTRTYTKETAKGIVEVTQDESGKIVSERVIGDLPPHAPKDPPQENQTQAVKNAIIAFQTLRDNPQFGPKHPQTLRAKELVIGLSQAVPTPQGGSVQSKVGFLSDEPLNDAPRDPKAPPAGPRTKLEGPAVQPNAGQQVALAQYDTTIGSVNGLLAKLAKPEIQSILGGFTSNPRGALRRALGEVIPSALSSEQREFLAGLGFEAATLKRELIGAAQTNPELKGLVDSLPDKGNIDASIIPKLEMIAKRMMASRANLGNVMRQSNVNVPQPMSPSGGPTSDADQRAAKKYGL